MRKSLVISFALSTSISTIIWPSIEQFLISFVISLLIFIFEVLFSIMWKKFKKSKLWIKFAKKNNLNPNDFISVSLLWKKGQEWFKDGDVSKWEDFFKSIGEDLLTLPD